MRLDIDRRLCKTKQKPYQTNTKHEKQIKKGKRKQNNIILLQKETRTGDELNEVRMTCGMDWCGIGWDGMGWDGMGWDGMGWDGMLYEVCYMVLYGT